MVYHFLELFLCSELVSLSAREPSQRDTMCFDEIWSSLTFNEAVLVANSSSRIRMSWLRSVTCARAREAAGSRRFRRLAVRAVGFQMSHWWLFDDECMRLREVCRTQIWASEDTLWYERRWWIRYLKRTSYLRHGR